jgi:predicted nucleic acid-binding Zn ribbon protein
MRTVGELLSLILDEKVIKKAKTYSVLTSSWAGITERSKIPAAADHSRILDLDHGILQIETDHPGWLQIFQIKQEALLSDVKARFPNLAISGIAFRLSRFPPEYAGTEAETPANPETAENLPADMSRNGERAHDKITDEDFSAALKRLEQSILSKDAQRKQP